MTPERRRWRQVDIGVACTNLLIRLIFIAIIVGWQGLALAQWRPGRSWSGDTGQFRGDAARGRQDDSSVQNQEVENGTAVVAEFNRFSESDLQFPLRVNQQSGTGPAAGVDQLPWLKTGPWVLYHVTMRSTMTIPENRNLKSLEVRHALPNRRPWTGGDVSELGAFNINFSPFSGKKKFLKKLDSHFVYFEHKKGLDGGITLQFETAFDVVSCQREFIPSKSRTTWQDFGKNQKRGSTVLPDELRLWVQEIRATNTPAGAVAKFCEWNVANLTYDASVSFQPSEIEKFILEKRGHCGHYCELTTEFCREAGIPARRVFGLNLYDEDGEGELSQIRSDFTNIHTWIEVFLPKEGWIEVEPADAKFPFRIPVRMIQNNPEFQNYQMAFRQGRETTIHQFDMNGNSEFGLDHRITFTMETTIPPREIPGDDRADKD